MRRFVFNLCALCGMALLSVSCCPKHVAISQTDYLPAYYEQIALDYWLDSVATKDSHLKDVLFKCDGVAEGLPDMFDISAYKDESNIIKDLYTFFKHNYPDNFPLENEPDWGKRNEWGLVDAKTRDEIQVILNFYGEYREKQNVPPRSLVTRKTSSRSNWSLWICSAIELEKRVYVELFCFKKGGYTFRDFLIGMDANGTVTDVHETKFII